MPAFTTTYTSVRASRAKAVSALELALTHTQPLDSGLAAVMAEARPQAYEQYLQRVAVIADTIPELRAKVARLRETEEAMREQACDRCSGLGVYQGASRYTRKGVPVCFDCHGDGRHAAARAAAAAAGARVTYPLA